MLSPSVAPAFEACGGEPFGTWETSEASAPSFDFPILGKDAFGRFVVHGNCPTDVHGVKTPGPIRFDIGDAGAFDSSGDLLSISFSLAEECVSTVSQGTQSCAGIERTTCTNSCGICECNGPLATSTGGETWTRQGTTLSFGGMLYDYCVSGDKLTLHGQSGLQLELHRIHRFSKPTACASRSSAMCTKGCTLGECTGGATCEVAETEATCTNRQGCSWDAKACIGTPAPCALGDYGVIPGCDLIEAPLTCTGSRTKCRDVALGACGAAPGCDIGPGCTGGSVSCGALVGACVYCEDVTGCTYCAQGTGSCGGGTTCQAQPTLAACSSVKRLGMGECQWVEGLCVGEATPCTELSAEQCADAPGCTLEPSAP